MSRYINPLPQYLLADGSLASAGTLTFYATGTDNLLTLYSDENLTTTIANPVSLGDRGEVPNVFFEVNARVVLQDSLNNVIFDVDPVFSNGSGGSGGGLSGWDTNSTYSLLDIVYGSDGEFYISNTNENSGNDPVDTTDNSANWSRLDFLRYWNEQESYAGADIVIRSGSLYISQISNNVGIDPVSDSLGNWLNLTDALLCPYDNTTSGLVATNVKVALDELRTLINATTAAVTYRGQLDVSAGDAALPVSPIAGDFYIISTGGTITVSSNGGSPTPAPVLAGQAIVYNATAMQWDLVASASAAAAVSYSNTTSGLTATNVQTAIDEVEARIDVNEVAISGVQSTIAGLGAGATYRGQLDVSAGNSALPPAPSGGDLYAIAVGGTITVSVNGLAPAATLVDAGDSIIYNDFDVQWDLLVNNSAAVVDQSANYNWTGTHTFAIGLTASDLNLTGAYNFTGGLQVDGNAVYTSANINEAIITINAQVGTAYTAVLTDRNGLITMNNAAANTLTIPTNASVAYPVGTTLSIAQLGAGQTTITGDTGVTVNAEVGFNITAQYGKASAIKLATDTWLLSGSLSA